MSSTPRPLNRRTAVKLVSLAGALSAVRLPAAASPAPRALRESVLAYLESLAKPEGGYGFGDQEIAHLTPTYAVVGCYRLLRETPPRRAQLVEYLRRAHPREIKKLEQERRSFDFQQVQALVWLGAEVAEFRPRIAALTQPLAYLKQYEQHGYPVLQSELGVVMAHALLELPRQGITETFGRYLDGRRHANGSYNNTLAADGGDGHVMNTWWALQALPLLGRAPGPRDELVAWLRACQRPNGGFTYAPQPEFGGVDDIAYTRAAVRALQSLGSGPADREACLAQILALATAEGGFADRVGWQGNPLATYCALDALDALGALDGAASLPRGAPRREGRLPSDLKVYSIQIEAHGQGSAADAVELARSLQINLWGAKNARPEWLAGARARAAAERAPVQFFVANEEYGTWVNVPGLGTYSHTSDIVAPGGTEIGPSLAGAGTVSWPDYRDRRLAPLGQGRGRLIWQFGENEELVRLLLDDSVERGGFAAISTFHFGNPDFTNTEPFLHRWRGRIPFVALQDAHGPEPWWFADQTTGFRTLFLATEPTWDGWLRALQNHWVVAVRRDVWTRGKTWLHSSADEVAHFVRAREEDWRWWDHPGRGRPMVSVVLVQADDASESRRPAVGAALRIRCAWENTAQGLPKSPLAELVRLGVDGREVQPALEVRRRNNGQLEDHAHLWPLVGLQAGPHEATVVVRVLATGREAKRTITFQT